MKSTTRITLDIQRPNIAVIAYGVQNDRDSRYIEAQIVDGGTAWPLPAGASALIRFRKPDNTGGAYDTLEDNVTPAVTWSGSVATLVMAEQVLTVPGDVCMELNFYSADGERLTTFPWTLRVRPSVLTDAQIISSDYYNILTAQIASGIQAAENAAASAEAAQESADAAAATLAGAVQYTPQTGKTDAEKAAARANIDAVSSADVKLKLFSSVADVGLTVGSATITGVFSAMPDNSALIVNSTQFSAGETPVTGTVQIVKRGTVYAYILLFSASQNNPDYRMHVQSSAPTGTWVRLGPIVSQSTPTILSSAGTLNSGWIHRSGNVVVMSMNATVDLTTTATKIGEVPAGYRPISTVQGIALVGFNGCCYVGISSEGNISARAAAAASSQFFRVNLTWLAD